MWDENGGKGDVGIVIGVHKLYERVRVGGSRIVMGCDGGMNFKEGGIASDPYE